MSNIKTGDVVRKSFSYKMSKKFPDATIVVQSFGTEIERVCNSDKEEAELINCVYQSTRDEIINRSKTDPITGIITKTIGSQIKKEKRRDQAMEKGDD